MGRQTGPSGLSLDLEPWRRARAVAYLSCPNCGLTMFDRNPLTSPRHCPRCARRHAKSIELKQVPKLKGGAAASLLDGILRRDDEREPRGRAEDVRAS